jgi:hypothetical protein
MRKRERQGTAAGWKASKNAYAPIPIFSRRGLECAEGTVYTGCNWKNPLWGSRSAPSAGPFEGRREGRKNRPIAVYAEGEILHALRCLPPDLVEFAPDMEVLSPRSEGGL